MKLKYDIEIPNEVCIDDLNRIINQIFKLLPNREGGGDWLTPLENLMLELKGFSILLNKEEAFLILLCKMEALKTLTKEEDFPLFRKTIFECLGLCGGLKQCLI